MKLNTTSTKDSLRKAGRTIKRYSVLLFVVFLLGIYSCLTWRIVSLNQVQPDLSSVEAKLKMAGVPRIDQDALHKIQQLQDNSVEVQTLFDKARSNPFQE